MSEEPLEFTIPENFKTTLLDFLRDLSTTFPEFAEKWEALITRANSDKDLTEIFRYCLGVYPERFFDLLYQNEDIFSEESRINTAFLPGIEFHELYHCDGVTETTKKSIWKYLQLLMFSILGSVKDKSHFGESMNMFEGIDESELQSKMKETLDSIGDFFQNLDENLGGNTDTAASTNTTEDDDIPEFTFDKTTGMPNLNDLHEHLKGLFDGKIGRLAKNIAEEISSDFEHILGEEYADVKSTKDVFQKMMKNPKKMMDLIKKVGDKIKSKMDSGEISKDDIMAEAGEILRKMKDMGGGSDDKLQEMLRNMAKNMGMGKNTRVDMNAVNRMTKQQATKDRLRSKLQAKRAAAAATTTTTNQPPSANYVLEQTGQSNYVFKMPEEGEQPRSSIPPPKYTDDELVAEFSASTNTKQNASTKNKKKKSKKQ